MFFNMEFSSEEDVVETLKKLYLSYFFDHFLILSNENYEVTKHL